MGGSEDGQPLRLQACKRCHTRKRKCDRGFPRCGPCVAANAECEIDSRSGDAALLAEIGRLRARVVELEAQTLSIASGLAPPPSTQPPFVEERLHLPGQNKTTWTSYDLHTLFNSILRDTPGSSSTLSTYPFTPTFPYPTDAVIDPSSPLITHATRLPTPPGLPPYETTIEMCRRYTRDHKMTHQMTNFGQLCNDAQIVYGRVPDKPASLFRLMIVLHLSGENILEYTKWDPQLGSGFRARALAELPKLLVQADITAVQAMTMLSVVAIYNDDLNLWQTAGVGVRTAVAINMHRNDEVFLAPYRSHMDAAALDALNDHRKRVFWTLYLIERLVQYLFGHPPVIRDEDIDVELPPDNARKGIPPSPSLQHAVLGRRLLGIIHTSLFGPNVSASDFGEAIVAEYVAQVQTWYASGPLKAAFVPLSEATIKRQSLDDMSYQSMILLLHRPSRLLPRVPSSYISTLLTASTVYLDLFDHYRADDKVITHWCHLYQLFTAATIMVYAISEYKIRQDLTAVPQEEIKVKMDLCKAMLRKFDKVAQATRLQAAFDILAGSLESSDPTSPSISLGLSPFDFGNIPVETGFSFSPGAIQGDGGSFTTSGTNWWEGGGLQT